VERAELLGSVALALLDSYDRLPSA
jgi:hypothetical protein